VVAHGWQQRRHPSASASGFRDLLDRHADVERLARQSNGRNFVSGWNAANPFAKDFLGDLTVHRDLDATAYQSYSSDDQLLGLIEQMHARFDCKPVDRSRILPGDGSTGLIATIFLWLRQQQIDTVYYVPTVHDTFYFFFELLGLTVRRVSEHHPFESQFTMNLPDQRSVLFVADPTWYVGRTLAPSVIDEISHWQRRTESLVFVDGTWQYLQWDGRRNELSAHMDSDLTVRLIGPTKFLGLNGHRFSYLVVPGWLYDGLADMHENLHGSTSVSNLAFARRAVSVMVSPSYNRALTDHVAGVYADLVATSRIETEILPDCGLYCFAKLAHGKEQCVTMGGEYYELDGYPEHVRVNLLGGEELNVLTRRDCDATTFD
jgi:histidinol-phosphate/aromatic aminotransferase/cobyric acid decarboxylase-like protein